MRARERREDRPRKKEENSQKKEETSEPCGGLEGERRGGERRNSPKPFPLRTVPLREVRLHASETNDPGGESPRGFRRTKELESAALFPSRLSEQSPAITLCRPSVCSLRPLSRETRCRDALTYQNRIGRPPQQKQPKVANGYTFHFQSISYRDVPRAVLDQVVRRGSLDRRDGRLQK